MIFDIIKFGIFTADDFFTANNTNNFTKFTALPIDLRKKFLSYVIDLYPNKESKNFKQAAFDFIDGKITEKQFRDTWWKYQAVAAAEQSRPYFEDIAKHLNKLIQEYENDKIN